VEELIYSKMGRQEILPHTHTYASLVFLLNVLSESPETKFLNDSFVEVSGHNLESFDSFHFSEWSFCLVFYPRFSVLQNAIHE
jgi:hypothetical protein